jgi:hypothetical protein
MLLPRYKTALERSVPSFCFSTSSTQSNNSDVTASDNTHTSKAPPRHSPDASEGNLPSRSFMSQSTSSPSAATSSSPSSPSNYSEMLQRLDHLWMERTGTAEISQLKQDVTTASFEFDAATRNVALARRKVDETLIEYESINRRHNSLLHKRDKWTPDDASSFAMLVNLEVTTRQQLEEARTLLQTHEEGLSKSQLSYMNAMRRRYHEEQIWQDKWRVFGTYGTWTLIMLNSLVFLASQYVHRIREVGRIKAIETLINEKIPTPLVAPVSNVGKVAAAAAAAAAAATKDVPIATKKAETAKKRLSSTIEEKDQEQQSTTKELTISSSSASPNAQQQQPMPSKAEGKESESKSTTKAATTPSDRPLPLSSAAAIAWLHSRHKSWTSHAQDIVASLHLPSAAVGATITSAAFGIAILVVGSRRQ